MRRRSRTTFEDMMDLIVLLPWQASLLLAPFSYLLLHVYASQKFASPTGMEDAAGAVIRSGLLKTLATLGQYLLPAMFVLGAVVSMLKGKKRQTLLKQTARSGQLTALLDMPWQDFERLVGEAFRRQGYTVIENRRRGPDGGVDLLLKSGSETTLVQCKQWRARRVGVKVVRELYGVMNAQGASAGVIVCARDFTSDARAFAQGRNITLMDGKALLVLIGKVSKSTAHGKTAHSSTVTPPLAPACPICGNAMVKRTARKRRAPGKGFWGCANYPDCRGTRTFEPWRPPSRRL